MASSVTPEKVTAVLDLIENGMSERQACEKEGINRTSFRNAALKQGAGDQYARALEGLAAAQIEKLEQAIEDMRSKKIDAAMARVEIDARKWFASKFLPKRYGDSLDLTTKGDKINNIDIKALDDKQLAALETIIGSASDDDGDQG